MTTNILKLLILAMLLFPTLAAGKEPVLQAPETGPLSHAKKNKTANNAGEAIVLNNAEKGDAKAEQSLQMKAEKQDCVGNNCQQHQAEQRLKTPLGARISDTLTRQDREAAVEILEHERLLLNEEMNLLFLSGRKNEAADIAFSLMDRSSLDESLYQQSAPILSANTRTAGGKKTSRNFDGYNEILDEIIMTGHQFGGFIFDFNLHQAIRSNVDSTIYGMGMDEVGAEIAMHQIGNSYVNTIKLRYVELVNIDQINPENGVSFNHQRQLGSRLQLDARLAYNQAATENSYMRIFALRDQIALDTSYRIDGANLWSVRGEYNQYHSFDEKLFLGRGNLLSSTLSHELSNVYPVLRARITGIWSQFDAAGFYSYMPINVSEIAIYGSIGDVIESRLPAHDFESFAEIGSFDNPSSGSGWRASAGLAGRVVGADRLQIFMRYDQSLNGQGYSSLEAGLGYLLNY